VSYGWDRSVIQLCTGRVISSLSSTSVIVSNRLVIDLVIVNNSPLVPADLLLRLGLLRFKLLDS
jgi:hypothetical protein